MINSSQAQFSVALTRSSDLVQCRSINSHSLSPISHDSRHKLQRVRVASTQRVLRPLSCGGVGCSHFWSGGQSWLWHVASPLCEKEALVKKKVPVWRIAAEAPTSASGGSCYGPGKAPKEDASLDACPAQKLRIAAYFGVWWSLNVVFNIYNKKVLDAYPFPWLTATLSLAAGSAIMLVSWALGIVEAPHVDCDFWKRLAPVAAAHAIGHVAATVSMSKVAVSFTHIIKSSEPAFSVLIQRSVFGERFPCAVYLTLLPIIGGCGLAAATELNFNPIGLAGAVVSNVAFVFRNVVSKRGMGMHEKEGNNKHVGGVNYYACLSIMSLAFVTPFAFAFEGPKAWAAGWKAAKLAYGNQVIWWLVTQSVF